MSASFHLKKTWPLLILLIAITTLFWKPLFASEEFLFRDAAHFYPPQWKWARAEWAAGRVPLWNPLINLGEPHLADNTSSVFYPGKLLFALPFGFNALYNVFLVGHVALAGFSMWLLARRWHLSIPAAAIASISYPLSGSIVFQYCNPPFLIGAAWLPAAVLATWEMLKLPTLRKCAILGVVLTIIILGGDAQSVYHVGLMMTLLAFLLWRNKQNSQLTDSVGPVDSVPLSRSLFWITTTTVLVSLLAAVQVLPTIERTQSSVRANSQAPTTVYEFAAMRGRGKETSTQILRAKADVGSHHQRVYEFSIGPWRWLELLWPNIGGKMFPTNSRWMNHIPAESRVWSPSLYSGLLPFLLCWGCLREWKSRSVAYRWIVLTTILGTFASLGLYGAGWLIAEFHNALGRDTERLPIGHAFGGLYWLMNTTLPCYSCFRYPAKLWTLVAFGISLIAGLQWDNLQQRGFTEFRRRLLMVIGLTGFIWLMVLLFQGQLQNQLRQFSAPDSVFGPLQLLTVTKDVIFALTHASLAAICFWGLSILAKSHRSGLANILLVSLLAADLLIAHQWMIQSARLPIANPINISTLDVSTSSPGIPARAYRPARNWRPENWNATSSRTRMEQLVKWDRKTMFPHYHLDAHVGLIHAPVTIPNADVSQVFDTARKVAHQRDIPETTLAALGVTHQLLRSEEWRAVSDRLPRCWITKKIEWEPMGTRNLEEIWFPDGLQRDFRESSTIESSNERVRSTESLPDIAVGSCQILEYAAQSIHIRATMQTPGVMILSDVYDNDWRCESRSNADGDWKPLPIMRANRIMRAVLLGPGDHEIRFQYAPHSFYWGAGLSAVSCLGLLILIFQRKNEVQP